MDFYRFISTKLADASLDERAAFYEDMRSSVARIIKRAGQGEGSDVHLGLMEKFEAAVRAYEAERVETNAAPQVSIGKIDGDDRSARVEPDVVQAPSMATPANDVAPAKKSRSLLFLALGLALGMAAFAVQNKLSNADTAALVDHFHKRMPVFKTNLTHLQRVRSALEAQHAQTGRFPPTPETFVPLASVVGTLPTFSSLLNHTYEEGSTLLYRSDGKDYKLVLYRSGDCFVARVANPEMIDLVRGAGPVDCIYYGYWTAGGAGW